ncbi:MAG: CopG family ribbon-helix-helix protein [Promethearchaeota archaeon]
MPMISLQVSDEIFSRLEKVQRNMNYTSRSEFLRDAILQFIEKEENKQITNKIKRAVLSISYYSDFDTLDILSEIERRFEKEIKNYMEYNLNKNFLRVYIVVGEDQRIIDMKNAFNQIKNTQKNLVFI